MNKDKFIEKNGKAYLALEYVKNKGIRYAVTSIELATLVSDDSVENLVIGHHTLDGKLLLVNTYHPVNKIDFILKDNNVFVIEFELPCICGRYGDEKHNICNQQKDESLQN